MSHEVILYNEMASYIALAIPLLGMALTLKQKEWVRNRDHNKCQFPDKHDCNGDKKTLHVHHIMPQRYCQKFGADPDVPDNVLSVCENSHVGNGTRTPEKVIHPDIMKARHEYRDGDKGAYDKVFKARDHLLDERQIYWVETWDRAMRVLALAHTQQFGEEWPINHSRIDKPDSHKPPD